jgi:hypothetical protein
MEPASLQARRFKVQAWLRRRASNTKAMTTLHFARIVAMSFLALVFFSIVFGSNVWVVETTLVSPVSEDVVRSPTRAAIQDGSRVGDTRRSNIRVIPATRLRGTSGMTPRNSSSFANGAAIRAPPRPPRVIPISADLTSLPQSAHEGSRCYDRTGAHTNVPRWFPELYDAMRPRYHALVDAVEDPWTVLVGWVPDHFMPPQKLGKKANGDVMVPPTKGRNASYYLEAYNASWHATVRANNYEYHFQLMHRNSLAVCIRERLHIFQYFCTPSAASGAPVSPITVYQCPCRHCQEGTLPAAKGDKRVNMDKAIPSFRSQLLQDPLNGEMKISTSGVAAQPPFHTPEGCVESLAAPWLIPRSAPSSTAFPYEGLEENLEALLAVQADSNKIVLVAIFNVFWLDHLHNFVYSMVSKAHVVNFIIATMDADALALCVANRLPCFDATEYAEYEPDMEAGGLGRAQGRLRKVTEAMAWIKPRLAVAVLRRGYGFLMSDLDLTWNKSPWKEVLDVRVDIAHQCDANNKFSINSGFYFARANARTIRYFENLMSFRPEENSDQTAMKLFSRYDHTHGASNTCLGKWSFNMKCNYKVPGSVKRVGDVETFEWRPYDTKEVQWTILHATCLSGATSKLLYLRTIGAWSLDALDSLTNRSATSDVCIWQHHFNHPITSVAALNASRSGGATFAAFVDKTKGTKVGYRNVATKHDEMYVVGMTSDMYLKKRH